MLHRSVWGFRLSVLGRNARTAQRTGVSVVRSGAAALAIGGAMAGLAGAAMLAGGTANYRYTPGFANNVGWEGLLVALVARNRPLVCIPVALVFAALRTGSGFLAATGVERSIVDVVRALLVLALLVPPAVAAIRRRRAAVEAPTPALPSGAPAPTALGERRRDRLGLRRARRRRRLGGDVQLGDPLRDRAGVRRHGRVGRRARRHAQHLDRGDDDRRGVHGRRHVRPDHVALAVDQPVAGDGGWVSSPAPRPALVVSLVQANLSHRLSIDQFVVGLTLNLFVLGLALFLDSRWEAVTSVAKPTRVPLLSDIPLVGDALFGQPWPMYLIVPVVPFAWWLVFHTRWGLEVRSVGDNPQAADVSGITVNRRRRQGIMLAGLASGLGGGVLVLGQISISGYETGHVGPEGHHRHRRRHLRRLDAARHDHRLRAVRLLLRPAADAAGARATASTPSWRPAFRTSWRSRSPPCSPPAAASRARWRNPSSAA